VRCRTDVRRIPSALRRLITPACLAACLALCMPPGSQPLFAAQSPAHAQTTRTKAAAGKKPPAGAESRAAQPAPDVYAQNAYTEKELIRFIESMPHFRAWVQASKAKVHPVVNAAGKPDFTYTPEAAAKARELGWEPRRFFCLLGRSAAALYLVGEGTDLVLALPPDMPTVTDAEMALVRKHLAALLRAGSDGPAPSLSR